jgi:hypothetical protein
MSFVLISSSRKEIVEDGSRLLSVVCCFKGQIRLYNLVCPEGRTSSADSGMKHGTNEIAQSLAVSSWERLSAAIVASANWVSGV